MSENRTLPTAISLLIALLVAVIVFFVMHYDLTRRIAFLEIHLHSESTGQVVVDFDYWQRNQSDLRQHQRMADIKRPSYNIVKIPMYNLPAANLGIRFETSAEVVSIHQLRIAGTYGESLILRGAQLTDVFDIPGATPSKEYLNVLHIPTHSALTRLEALKFDNALLETLVPILIGSVVLLLLQNFRVDRIPSLRQLQPPLQGDKPHHIELDGLRGVAALVVVLDHTWGLFTGSGLGGVWIFFALSGYLLTIPFVNNPYLVFDRVKLQRYFLRRLGRILPMYYVTLFLYFMVPGKVNLLFSHLLFLRGDGHLWTIPQEIIFYLVLPAVLAVMAGLSRFGLKVMLPVLLMATVALMFYDYALGLRIVTGSEERFVFFGWFLSGVLVSYLLNHYACRQWFSGFPESLSHLTGVVALIILIGSILAGSVTLAGQWYGRPLMLASVYREYYGFAAAFLVFAAVVARQSVYGWVLRWRLLRSIGIMGFSVYLIHPMLLELVRKFVQFYFDFRLVGYKLFIVTVMVTWFVATITYNLVEYPFLKKRTATRVT